MVTSNVSSYHNVSRRVALLIFLLVYSHCLVFYQTSFSIAYTTALVVTCSLRVAFPHAAAVLRRSEPGRFSSSFHYRRLYKKKLYYVLKLLQHRQKTTKGTPLESSEKRIAEGNGAELVGRGIYRLFSLPLLLLLLVDRRDSRFHSSAGTASATTAAVAAVAAENLL